MTSAPEARRARVDGRAQQRRRNLLDGFHESFRPPAIMRSANQLERTVDFVHRVLDLQYGSIHRDLQRELADVHGTILDAGCGGQPYRSLMRRDANYIGLDIADAKEKFGYMQPDTVYYSGDVWPIETASLDFILCTETLEHVIEPGQFLS